MQPFSRLIIFLLFVGLHQMTVAQNCGCTIAEVETNNVTPCPTTLGTVVNVASASEFRAAINQANNSGGNMTILITDGTYEVASTASYPYLTASNVVIRSESGNRDAVVLTGGGMRDVAPLTENGIYVVGDHVTIADLTIRDVGNHGIAVEGDNMYIHNVLIQNTFEQMIKGTSGGDGADSAIVQCSLMEYPSGVGPQFYIGGLDIHEGEDWLVRDNIFKNISSPSGSLAEHAIHFWDFSANNIIERNWIINCDRGIGFGLGSSPNEGGIIRNNMIFNDGSGQFHDVGIGLETSPNTRVYNNTIHIEYPNAIEYRFAATVNVDIANNLTNQLIRSRNGGQANLESNMTNGDVSWYISPSMGDLRLANPTVPPVDQGIELLGFIEEDIDQIARPQFTAVDIGAHEYAAPVATDENEISEFKISIFPNPATTVLYLENIDEEIVSCHIYDEKGQLHYSLEKVDQEITEISIQNWASGVYYCVGAFSDGQIEVHSLIVE